MGTDIRPEISTKSKFWIGKHRYYELKHFCLQYPEWRKIYISLDGMPGSVSAEKRISSEGTTSDPTAQLAERRLYFAERMEMVERAARESAENYDYLILRAVTNDLSYEKLRALETIPFCKDTWYVMYRKFFWILDKSRQ